jgi:RNA polymerase sigma-70 factor (ECF subfamily)
MAWTRSGGAATRRGKTAVSDPLEIGELHERYLDAVFAYVRLRVASSTEAEDVTAEVFAAALAALPHRRGGSGHYAWLLGIARRKIVDATRRRQRRPELLDTELGEGERAAVGLLLAADQGPLPEEIVQNEEARQIMRRLVAGLPEPQREVLLLQVVHGLPIREIARVIGRTEAATNSLLQRARAAIFRHGKDYFVD